MEEHHHPFATSPTAPRFPPPYSHGHRRNISRSPTRNRISVTDDIFTDFSPTRILEAFINPTGRLKASIDAASQTDRMFGIRAAHASKNIQEWVRELEDWEWPTEGGASKGFEVPPGKRRKLFNGGQGARNGSEEHEYIGSLPAPKVLEYEARIDHIQTELEDLHVEEIKRHVLETHFTPSRPSSSSSNASSTYLSSYTKMEDFTAIVTATVLKALPNLSKLNHLMDIWTVRLSVLHKVPQLLHRLEEGETALQSGWTAIQIPANSARQDPDAEALTRVAFEIMRSVLQDKVTTSGRDLDFMLDALEGREDTLPDSWLDRMEAIEHDYGEWVVAGDRKVREGDWAKMARIRKAAEEEARRDANEVARIQADLDAKMAEAELQRLLVEKKARYAEDTRLKVEQDAQKKIAEDQRLRLERESHVEVERLYAEKCAAELTKAESEKAQKLQEEATNLENERRTQDNAARLKAKQLLADTETAKLRAQNAEPLQLHKEQSIQPRSEEEELKLATQAALDRGDSEEDETDRLRLEAETEKAMVQGTQLEKLREFEVSQGKDESKSRKLAAENLRLAGQSRLQALEANRINQARELAQLALIEQQQIQEKAAAKLREEEQAQKEATESKRIQEDQEAREEVDRLQKQSEAAALMGLEEERKFRNDHLAKLDAQNTECDLAAARVARRDALESAFLHALQEQATRDAEIARENLEGETARLKFEADAVESVKLQAEKDAMQLDQEMAIRDVRDAEIKELERLQTLRNAQAEENRVKAFRVAENECIEIARVRALLLANEKAEQHQHPPHKIDQFSDVSPNESPIVPVASPSRAVAPAITRKSGFDSACDVCERNLTPPKNKYATFDGNNDLEPEFLAYYEGNDIAFDQESNPDINSAEEWASTGRDSALYSSWHGISEPPTSTDSTPFAFREGSDHFASNIIHERSSNPTLQFARTIGVNPNQNLDDAENTPDDSSDEFSFETELETLPKTKRSTFGFDPILPIQHQNASDSLPANHPRSPSLVEYTSSDPTPILQNGEPASYFLPLISPVEITPSSISTNGANTPTSSLGFSDMVPTSVSSTIAKPELPQKSPRRHTMLQLLPKHNPTPSLEYNPPPISSFDGSSGSVPARSMEMELHDFKPHSLARKTSITRINSPSPISIGRRDSISSNTSTVISSPTKNIPVSLIRRIPSPIRPTTPTSPQNSSSFHEDDLSPSIRRHRNGNSHDYTSPNSPPPIPDLSQRIPISHKRNDSFSSLSRSSDSPTTPTFSVEPSPALPTSPKKASSDSQMQQQISNLLESIPARIRLTTESEVSTPDTSLSVTKARCPVASSLRPSSSLSNYSRAPTPSFTLAPARGAPRQRAQNGNPEIKVYHLSRSTGEAPIKLFVRLVGENGERVMVRVGGGWADLGEYLKEYASHHGRRAAVGGSDKVEIQDLPARVVSTGSSSMTTTMRSTSMTSTFRSSSMTPTLRPSSSITNLRSNGRASPAPPPSSRSGSAMGFNRPPTALGRPIAGLSVRKTRQSTGSSNLDLPTPSNSFRSPSTPIPSALSRSAIPYDTTPSPELSERERSNSRLSWTEEESSLGLAGPKSKKVIISEKDQEWVESMKEKVRLASAEKDKEKMRRESGGRKSFGEMDRVGGVKRLWRKGGL